jgi:peroxiredoxin
VILTFYRGGWCPFCTKALAGWEGRMDEVEALGATFVAITPESPDNAASTGAKHAPSMTILSDPHHEASRNFHLSFNLPEDTKTKYKGYGIDLEKSNASHNWELPAPGTYVIGRDGTIVYAWADWDYKKRADPDQVLAAAKAAAKK